MGQWVQYHLYQGRYYKIVMYILILIKKSWRWDKASGLSIILWGLYQLWYRPLQPKNQTKGLTRMEGKYEIEKIILVIYLNYPSICLCNTNFSLLRHLFNPPPLIFLFVSTPIHCSLLFSVLLLISMTHNIQHVMETYMITFLIYICGPFHLKLHFL